MTTHQRKALMPQDHGSAAPMLSGLRVLEIGHFIAAPFCTRLLGDLGADVIKIEPPAGDPARQWGEMVNGRSLWWSLHGRNKRSVPVEDRKSVVWGRRGSVRVDIGGRGFYNKKTYN